MASKRALWNKVGRYFSAIVIAAFFLPFFGVSCEGMDVVTVSGADMVGGCKPGGMISEMEKQESRKSRDLDDDTASGGRRGRGGGMGGGAMGHVDNVEREPLAIVALALAVFGFGAAWMRNKKGVLASFALSIATLGVLVGLYIKVGGELRDAVDKETLGAAGSSMKHDVKVDAGGRYGLWLTGLMLVSIAVITGRAMREPETMPDALPPPAVPPPAV